MTCEINTEIISTENERNYDATSSVVLEIYPFIYYLQNLEISPNSVFNLIHSNAFNSSDYIVLNDKMISELDRTWMEEVMA
jgi:hypothetical protein